MDLGDGRELGRNGDCERAGGNEIAGERAIDLVPKLFGLTAGSVMGRQFFLLR